MNPYDASVTAAQLEVSNMITSISTGFTTLIPVGLGLVALVMGVFWLLRKGKKFASSAN